MSGWGARWVVMVPGEVAWVERRTREILEEEQFEDQYTVIPGQGRYQAIVQADDRGIGPEMVLGELFSLECEEPVYCIDSTSAIAVWRWVKGESQWDSREADEVARALGCVMPWDNEPQRPMQRVTRRVMLIQGLGKARVSEALEKDAVVRPLPLGYYCLEEVPQGLILRDGTGELVFEDIKLAQRFPRAKIYAVTAKPSLDFFIVRVWQGSKTSEFVLPPTEFPQDPVLEEVMGERTPERILAALGMSKEWFQL